MCRGGAGRRGAVSAASSTGGFVAVHRPTWVGTTGWSVLAWLMREPARLEWVLLGGVCWPG